ncbi:MAG: hypothetical protein J6D03_09690 [Clostridia bacterium]|nr:hypothetical protein [Clostridia bacterium]
MPYFQYEEYLELIQEFNKEEENRRKQEEKQYKMPNMNNMMSSVKRNMPTIPKMNIPKL